MASNAIPRAYDPLIQLATDAANGARDHGPSLGLAHHPEAKIRADLEAVVGKPAGPGNSPPAVPGLKALLNAALTAKVQKTAEKNSAQSDGRALAAYVVASLEPRLGKVWSAAWKAVGFTAGDLKIPKNPMTLLQQMKAYYLANPTHEIPDYVPGLVPKIALTAAACEAAAQAISEATAVSNQSNTDAGNAKSALDAGLAALRARLSGLLNELSDLLKDDDARWYAFGFNRPADPETGEVVENLVLSGGAPGSGRLFADWDDARRAESYRVTVLSKEPTPRKLAEKIVTESEATFDALPAGQEVDVIVVTLNDAGASQPSEAKTIRVP